MLTESGEQGVGDLDGNSRHRIRVLENEPLQIREMGISPVVIQVGDLLFGNPALSADGRAYINSKRASDERSNTQVGQTFQSRNDELAAYLGLLHLQISPEEFRMVRGHLNRHNDAPQTPTSQVINKRNKKTAKRATLVCRSTWNSCHIEIPEISDSLLVGTIHFVVQFLQKLCPLLSG